ncbi:MAG: DUF2341 domain-containing protein [Candidatus Pacebacteria bacterium]|nr:DUF2341 domain-containing protein [Candidatus Paceibacterota bacterium]
MTTEKKLIISFFTILFLAVGFFCYHSFKNNGQDASAAGESWLSDYSRRKAVTITNPNTGISGTVNGSAALGGTGKFGTAITMDGTDDYISFADSADWDFDGDFTIDFWINSSNISAYQFPLVHRNYPSYVGAWHFYISGSKFTFSAADNSGTAIISLADTTTRTSNTWYHVAIVRSGATANMYVNGSLAVSDTSASGAISNDSDVLIVGYLKNYGAYFAGSLDEVRISKGIARWTSNFVPSTSAYSNDSYTKLLLHLNETSGTTVYSDLTLTDYQVKLTVPYDSDMQADFDDLRFTSSDGTTLLNYWLESKTDSSTATIWVKVPTLSSGSNTIYMYYGNASAASGSNGANTFRYFDDFSSSTNWNFLSGASISGNQLTVNVYNPGFSWPMATYKTAIAVPYVLMYEGYIIDGSQSATRFSDAVGMTTYSSTDPQSVGVGYLDNSRLYGDYNTGVYSSLSFSAGTWYKVDHAVTGSSSKITINGVSSQTSISHTTGRYVGFGMAHQNSKYRNFAIREYAATEPTSSFSLEESIAGPTPPTVTNLYVPSEN